MKRLLIITAIISFTQISCDRYMPAGFWAVYQTEFLKDEMSNQGPWGGYRAIHWESADMHEFEEKSVLKFAEESGWSLINCFPVDQNRLEEWVKNDEDIFPAFLTGFEYGSQDSISFRDFPRWIKQDLTVCKFKTGWVRLFPGTDDWTSENGFILISKDGRKMTLYHLWGE